MYSETFTGFEEFRCPKFPKKCKKTTNEQENGQNQKDIEHCCCISFGESHPKIDCSYISYFFRFISSPRVCFILETAFFIFFLCLFSYFLMREMDFGQTLISEVSTHEQFNSSTGNFSNPNDANHSIKHLPETNKYDKQINMPGIAEIILAFWVFTYFTQELVQV